MTIIEKIICLTELVSSIGSWAGYNPWKTGFLSKVIDLCTQEVVEVLNEQSRYLKDDKRTKKNLRHNKTGRGSTKKASFAKSIN